jgi:hypothetical protein
VKTKLILSQFPPLVFASEDKKFVCKCPVVYAPCPSCTGCKY